MKAGERIPTPWKQRWRRFRYSALPGICFFACVALMLSMWRAQGRLPNAVGEVESIRIAITAGTDGTLAPLVERKGWWAPFETVENGGVIALLDKSPAKAAIAVLQAERTRLERDVEAAAEQLKLDMLNTPVNISQVEHDYIWDVERLRLEILNRDIQIAADTIERQRLDARLSYLKRLAEKRVAVEMQVVDTQLLREETNKRIETNQVALAEEKAQLLRAEQRRDAVPQLAALDLSKIVAPLRAAIATQEKRILEFEIQVELLEVRAPFAGTICEVHLWPGQHVQAGDPIVTMARQHDGGTQYVVSYVRQEQRFRPSADMEVDLRMRLPGSPAMTTKVVKVGPEFELIPLRQLRDPQRPEFGQPVIIELPEQLKQKVHPGELLDVTFKF